MLLKCVFAELDVEKDGVVIVGNVLGSGYSFVNVTLCVVKVIVGTTDLVVGLAVTGVVGDFCPVFGAAKDDESL